MIMKIMIIAGSPRTGGYTVRIAKNLLKHFSALGYETDMIDLSVTRFPFIQKVWSNREEVPEEFKPLWDKMESVQSFVFVTPEYNGGYSPAMKNFMDHFPKSFYHKKAFGIVAGSTGIMGGMRASQQMFLLTAGFWGIASPTMLLVPEMDKKFAEDGSLTDEKFQASIDRFSADYLWLAEKLSS